MADEAMLPAPPPPAAAAAPAALHSFKPLCTARIGSRYALAAARTGSHRLALRARRSTLALALSRFALAAVLRAAATDTRAARSYRRYAPLL